MSEYSTGMSSRLGTDSFLYSQRWGRTSTVALYTQEPYMGEQTGGSPYICASGGLPGMPHMPVHGNQFHGVGDTFDQPEWDKYYADNCIYCGTRIENKYQFVTRNWRGWRPTATIVPGFIIEEEPV